MSSSSLACSGGRLHKLESRRHGVAMSVVERLREEGHARDLREEALQRVPDNQIFAKAIGDNRVVQKFDLDFGEIVAAGRHVVNVVILRLRTLHVIGRLRFVLREAG